MLIDPHPKLWRFLLYHCYPPAIKRGIWKSTRINGIVLKKLTITIVYLPLPCLIGKAYTYGQTYGTNVPTHRIREFPLILILPILQSQDVPSSSGSFFLPFLSSLLVLVSFLKFAATAAGSTLPTNGTPVLFTGTPRGQPTNLRGWSKKDPLSMSMYFQDLSRSSKVIWSSYQFHITLEMVTSQPKAVTFEL